MTAWVEQAAGLADLDWLHALPAPPTPLRRCDSRRGSSRRRGCGRSTPRSAAARHGRRTSGWSPPTRLPREAEETRSAISSPPRWPASPACWPSDAAGPRSQRASIGARPPPRRRCRPGSSTGACRRSTPNSRRCIAVERCATSRRSGTARSPEPLRRSSPRSAHRRPHGHRHGRRPGRRDTDQRPRREPPVRIAAPRRPWGAAPRAPGDEAGRKPDLQLLGVPVPPLAGQRLDVGTSRRGPDTRRDDPGTGSGEGGSRRREDRGSHRKSCRTTSPRRSRRKRSPAASEVAAELWSSENQDALRSELDTRSGPTRPRVPTASSWCGSWSSPADSSTSSRSSSRQDRLRRSDRRGAGLGAPEPANTDGRARRANGSVGPRRAKAHRHLGSTASSPRPACAQPSSGGRRCSPNRTPRYASSPDRCWPRFRSCSSACSSIAVAPSRRSPC